MKYFKIKTGYRSDEFISITEDELETAITAQITGKVGIFREGTIAGNYIMSITPDYHKILGFNSDYHLTGEDMKLIAKLKDEYLNIFNQVKIKVENQLTGSNKKIKEPEPEPEGSYYWKRKSDGIIIKAEKDKLPKNPDEYEKL